MTNAKAKSGKVKAIALVRDAKSGMPLIDNPLTFPKECWDQLTEIEKNYANSRVSPELRRFD